jgi:hypothetical protein
MPFPTTRHLAALFLLFGLAVAERADAGAITTQHFDSQAAFLEYLDERGLDAASDLLLLAQGRSGDNRIGGTWEVGLFPTDGLLDAKADGDTAQFAWPMARDGNPWVSFTLSRSADAVVFSVEGITTKLVLPEDTPLSALALSAQAQGKGETTILRSLTLDGDALKLGNVNAVGDKQDVALIEGLAGDFTLQGEARLRWAQHPELTDPSRLMFQIAGYGLAGDTLIPGVALMVTPGSLSPQAAIPAPGIGMALLIASLGLIGHRQMRRRHVTGAG